MSGQGKEKEVPHGKLRSLGNAVNSKQQEFAPVLNLEENTLYFTSDRPLEDGKKKGQRNVFVSYRKNDGSWKKPELLPLDSNKEETSVGVSPDGKTLFIERGGDLFRVEKKGGDKGWKRPKPMAGVINSEHKETHGSLSADETTFYFVSDRDGDLDIYRVKRLPTGEWSKAKKLSSSINTSKEENAPFIHPDGRTLFFSSSGHSKGKKADIFYSKKGDDGKWGTPVNMGYPISTDARNIHIMTSADGKRAYFASNIIKEDGKDKDLYRLDLKGAFTEGLAVLKGFVDVPPGSDLLDSTRVLIQRPKGMEGSKQPWIQRPRKRDGIFIAVLPPCHEYTLNYSLGRKEILKQELYVPCHSSFQKIRKEVFLQPIEFDPSVLDREPSLIGRLRYKSGAPVSKGTLYILKKGKRMDSVSIGRRGNFNFYHPDPERNGLLFRFDKEGPCKNTSLRLTSGGKDFKPLEQNGCLYRFPNPE
ncbi:MAG: hypothetical protein ABEH38_05565 [Flavobacteriales bacterium]